MCLIVEFQFKQVCVEPIVVVVVVRRILLLCPQ